MTLHPIFFWFLVIFAGFGFFCFLAALVILLLVLWIFRELEQEDRYHMQPDLKALKKQLSKVDANYR